MKIPKKYSDMIGTKLKMKGFIFNKSKNYKKFTEFDCLNVRFGTGIVMDMKTFKDKHPSIRFLLKNKAMKKAQWCLSMPCREINL